MSVLKIKDKDGKWVGVTAIQGEKGEQGMSPKIVVDTNNSSTYKLRVTTEDKDFITPNLRAGAAAYSGGNSNAELGTIDNYCDFEGEVIPPYNMDLPPLPMFRGGTKYVFESPVTMRIYNGTKDKNGNHDIDEYYTFESVLNEKTGLYEVKIKNAENGFLTDYLIYNPIPKKEWDTWINPNLLKILDVSSWKIGDYVLPNCKNDRFHSGEAFIYYNVHKNLLGEKSIKQGDWGMAVFNRRDFPFILDEPVKYWAYDSKEKHYSSNPIEIPYLNPDGTYPSEEWKNLERGNTCFKVGEDHTLEGMNLGCCSDDSDDWGNAVLMREARAIVEDNLFETREYDWIIANPDDIANNFPDYGAKPLAPAMFIGLEPNHNYTIETTAGDCAIIKPYNRTNKWITKEIEVQYPSVLRTEVVKKADAQSFNVGEANSGIGAGAVTGGSKLENGTVIHFNVVDEHADPKGKMEVPSALSCPNKYLKRGESYTFYVDDDAYMYGIWVMMENEDEYKGIKIVEGIEPYSRLMEERMASGATKFNVKVYCDYALFDKDDIRAEYNIKLSENTTEKDYCRFMDNHTIKHYDLDVFTMVGHQHNVAEIPDMEDYVESLMIPKMQLSTGTLTDGVSELPPNTFYFVYNE